MSVREAIGVALAVGAGIAIDAFPARAEGWEVVEPMPAPRAYHAAASVGDRWYVGGGLSFFGPGGADKFPSQVDVYDPTSGHWTTVGQLAMGREYLLGIADPSRGQVLFAGGFLPAGPDAYLALAACDVVGGDSVVSGPSLLGARHLYAMAFAAGKFVVSGGWGMEQTWSKLLDDAEVWDGMPAGWRAAGTMPAGKRAGHTMTTLKDGREVLVTGGAVTDHALKEVDSFDAVCGTWSAAAPLKVARAGHKAILLQDGRVLVVGGYTFPPTSNNVQNTAELFDPTRREWKSAASMAGARFDFGMVLLPDGRVLVAGGSNNASNGENDAVSSAEVYDPTLDAWMALPPMHDRRRAPTLVVLSDGVYVAGGSYAQSTAIGSGVVLASVERLPWSELGITGPITSDAGLPDEAPPDASMSCGSNDAGVSPDAASDAAAPVDGALDTAQPVDGAFDAGQHSDGAFDAAQPIDGALDAAQPSDGALDAAQPVDARDAPVVDPPIDRDPEAGKGGCSCSVEDTRYSHPGLALVIFGLALYRRSVRRARDGGKPLRQRRIQWH